MKITAKITKKSLQGRINYWADMHNSTVKALWDHLRGQEVKGANQGLEIKTLKATVTTLTENTRIEMSNQGIEIADLRAALAALTENTRADIKALTETIKHVRRHGIDQTTITWADIETVAAIQSRLNTLDTVCARQADRLYELTRGATTWSPILQPPSPARPYTVGNDPNEGTSRAGVVTAGTSRIEPEACSKIVPSVSEGMSARYNGPLTPSTKVSEPSA